MSLFDNADPFNDNFDPFNDDVLSIMTQRDTTESLSPVNKFWSQHELFPSPAIILDTEQEESIDDEFVSVNQFTDIFAGEDAQFIQDYHSAVNESVEILLCPEQYDNLTANCSSPLYECLVQKSTTLDDLNVGCKADKTYTTTYTAIRSFNFFWLNHSFNEVTEPALYAIRYKYGDMLDGFQALCTASHQERNIILAHYVTKMVKRVEVTRKNDVPFVMGRTKRGYLNSLMRGMKMYEKQHDLILLYGDWTWSKTPFYEQTKAALKSVTKKIESAISPSKLSKASEFMSDEQLAQLHDFTWELSENPALTFEERLKHKQAYLMQGLGKFECLRGRDELAMTQTDEPEIIDDDHIMFQMKRPFKSQKLGSDMTIRHKESMILKGSRYVQCLLLFLNNRPVHLATHLSLRLFLKPVKGVSPNSSVFYQAKVQGKEFCSKIVSLYANKLHDNKHPLFAEEHKFTNTSLRKFHTEKLANAGAPLLIQQQSLAQNTRFYTRGAHDMATKRKVAAIVAGEKKTWHSPDNTKQKSVKNTTSSNPLNTPIQFITTEQTTSTNTKKLKFTFQAPNANIQFEYDV